MGHSNVGTNGNHLTKPRHGLVGQAALLGDYAAQMQAPDMARIARQDCPAGRVGLIPMPALVLTDRLFEHRRRCGRGLCTALLGRGAALPTIHRGVIRAKASRPISKKRRAVWGVQFNDLRCFTRQPLRTVKSGMSYVARPSRTPRGADAWDCLVAIPEHSKPATS